MGRSHKRVMKQKIIQSEKAPLEAEQTDGTIFDITRYYAEKVARTRARRRDLEGQQTFECMDEPVVASAVENNPL